MNKKALMNSLGNSLKNALQKLRKSYSDIGYFSFLF